MTQPPRHLLDANVIVRFLTEDHASHARRTRSLLRRAEAGEIVLIVKPWIVAEAVYVLSSHYGISRERIAFALSTFLCGVGIEADEHPVMRDALARYASQSVDFADCLLAASAAAEGVNIASFDRDLDRFDDVVREEPH